MQYDIYKAIGLSSNPFSPATSSKGYFHTQATQRILEEIQFGIASRRGFILLVGEVGVGKTSLLLQLLDQMHKSTNGTLRIAWIFNTVLDRNELLHTIASDFGLQPKSQADFSELLEQINRFLLDVNASGGNCAIVVDEAHNLDGKTLESLRLLSNLESDENKLVQIVLSAQPELQSRLDQPEFRQLRSRIAISNTLPSLQKDEIKRYVDYKLSQTKSRLELPKNAVKPLFKATQGNLRLINLIMERALHVMYAMDQMRLDAGMIRKAINEVASFQKELRQRDEQKKWKILATLSLILLLVLVCGYFFLPGAKQEIKQWAGISQAVEHKDVPKPPDIKEKIKSEQVLEDDLSSFNQQMQDFLGPFGLQNLSDSLKQALFLNSPEILRSSLPDKLSLLGMHYLPENSELKYTFFPWQEYAETGPEWIVLWELPVRIENFYPDYTGEEIKEVQQKLKQLGYYDYNIDGYFGSVTWRSITAFQEDYGLKMTGTPTKETLFWLYAGVKPPEK